jgi:hypothetical protein
MRRTIVMLVAVAMIMGIITPILGVGSANAAGTPGPEVFQGRENEHATMIINRWALCGHDKYGDPLPGGKTFPWQHHGENLNSYWGRENYGMPNAVLALSSSGIAQRVRQNNFRSTVQPMLWTEVFLTIEAANGQSRPVVADRGDLWNVGRWYVVMDTAGQVWFDRDGHFHDSRYLVTADPFSPYYSYETDEDTGITVGSALANPLARVDPDDANNTQGPYQFSKETAGGEVNFLYTEPCYFWVRPEVINQVSSLDTNTTCDAYANHTLKGESRAWQMGILSAPDYIGEGIESPLGFMSDGVVRSGQWDIGMPVNAFGANEMFADAYGNLNSPGPAPAGGAYDVGDPLYRDVDFSGEISPGDIRLSDVTLNNPPITFMAGTTVQAGDVDAASFTDWSDSLYTMPSGFVYAAKGSGGGTTLRHRHLGDQTDPNNWANISSVAGAQSMISVSELDFDGDGSNDITAGSTVRIGPNANGESRTCTAVAVVETTPNDTGNYSYNYNGWYGGLCPMYGHRSWYYYYFNGWNNGDYVYFGSGNTGEMLQIIQIYNRGVLYQYYYGSPCRVYTYYRGVLFNRPPVFDHDDYSYSSSWYSYSYGRDLLERIQYQIHLDCLLDANFAEGDPVVPLSYNPGDFVYLQTNPGANEVSEGDIRKSNVDLHRDENGFKAAHGCWEHDALVMLEVLTADVNDPRYQDAVRNSDWHADSAGNTEYELMDKNGQWDEIDHPYATCMPTYDISVQSDFWQGERVYIDDPDNPGATIGVWRGVQPSVTACAIRSPNDDVDDAAHRIAKQTVLGPEEDDFFVHSATIHNVTPDYRSYLGLELFVDSGYDNNPVPNLPELAPVAQDLSDNYQRGDVCSAFAGATSRAPDLDLGRDLTRIDGSKDLPKFFDTDNPTAAPDDPGQYGCNEPVYFDIDNSGDVSAGDRRLYEVQVRTGTITDGTYNDYRAGSTVQEGDADTGRVLSRFLDPITLEPVYKFYDKPHGVSRLPSGILDPDEPIYWDHPEPPLAPDGDDKTNAGDIRLSDVDVSSAQYSCGETMGIGDVFTHEFPLFMISMGKNGDYNYMDFPVLPFPTMDVTVDMDMPLQVEQTSNVEITVNPPPKPGESIFVALRDTQLVARQPVPAVEYYSMENVTGEWLECSDIVTDGSIPGDWNTMWNASGYYGSGMYRENVDLPWDFTFFGMDFSRIEIGYNGYINLGTQGRYYTNLYRYRYWWTPRYAMTDAFDYPYHRGVPYITALSAWWRAPAEVCWGPVVWPDTGETAFLIKWKGENYLGGGDLEVELILFEDGRILIQFQNTECPAPYYSYYDGYSEVGIHNGTDTYYQWEEGGTCGFSSEANVMFTPGEIPAKPGRPALSIAEDDRWITEDNPVANFEFTPYRGTCLEDGTRSPVTINLYRDAGGIDDPAVVPRNPPPKTYLTYREPSYNINDPWNGRVIAVQDTFGYLKGDWVLVGGMRNTERRRITDVHTYSVEAKTEMIETSFRSLSPNNRSHILPVKSIDGFAPGAPVVVGWNHSPTQETHIAEAISRDIGYDDGTNPLFHETYVTQRGQRGENVVVGLRDVSGFVIGDFVGYGYRNWWLSDPQCDYYYLYDVAMIVGIDYVNDTITLDRIHYYYWYNSSRYRVAHVRGIKTRDPLKFQHYDECDADDRRAEPVVTATDAFSLHAGLNYDHIFGEPVVGIVYFDPFWVDNKWLRFDLDMYPTREFSAILPPDIVSPDLDNSYDCFWRGKFNVAPEKIDIIKARNCISVLDQRFPNVLLTLMDSDNPNDVNDPADIPMSCPAGGTGVEDTIIANVNATGCGVDYLMTAGWASPPRYIVQVNDDGTYYWWRWYEPLNPRQIFGALDSTDWLYKWLDNDNINPVTPWTRTPLPVEDNTYDLAITDNDLSIGGGVCDPCNDGSLWPCLGDVSPHDFYGRFMGTLGDPYSNYPNPNSLPANYGDIEHYGIPCVISRWTVGSDGGQIMFPVKPTKGGDLHVRVYTHQAVFDYNSSVVHYPGPFFVSDTAYGIDYCGYTVIKVLEADANVNFAEFRIGDHALQNSQVNYTTGVNPLYHMDPPAPRIQATYNPIIYDYSRQFRCYPGGQTHVGRLNGGIGNRWNAYPAIWENQFVKLGTEFFPLTDYGIYFILKDGTGNHIHPWRDRAQEADLAITNMRIKGPFMRPKYFDELSLRCIVGGDNPFYEYNNVIGLPIQYDYSGEINIDSSNFGAYCSAGGGDFSQLGNPLSTENSYTYANPNYWLTEWEDLYYGGFWYISRSNFNRPVADPVTPCYPAVWVIDEIIPVGSGDIEIEVELANGIKKVYEDCCAKDEEGTREGIPTHGLQIDGAPSYITVMEDNVFNLTLTEDRGVGMLNNGEWMNKECNDAVLFAWQDRGVVDPDSNYWLGPLDGQITMPPVSSEFTEQETAYELIVDRNNDGFITFNDWETEIVGRYEMATNTWTGGMIDARTFQRENGEYTIELLEDYGALIDQVGIDIGGKDKNGKPLLRNHVDHIIDSTETCPLNITAYKYGDDNQDRAFTPLYDEISRQMYSHEVYLAGQATIGVEPMRDLNVTYSPEPLTAGVVPELVNGEPFTLHVTDYNGEPVNLFELGIPDAHGDTELIDRSVLDNLFKDPTPGNEYYYGDGVHMPQYYWLRTDLHNLPDEEGTLMCNTEMYNDSFMPIEFGYDAQNGQYWFNGFIANDQTSEDWDFEIYVYTPDRRHSGVVDVEVVLPKVSYEVANRDQPSDIFDIPSTNGDPDFVMTGGDNRTYVVTATCRNAQDELLKGIADSVSVCSGEGDDYARFTILNTIPFNYWFGSYSVNNDGITNSSYYNNYFGVDENGDGSLTQLSIDHYEYGEIGRVNGLYYNTFNFKYTDESYEIRSYVGGDAWWPTAQRSLEFIVMHDIYSNFNSERSQPQFQSIPRQWGYACVYNHPYRYCYTVADLNRDNDLSYKDSLSLNEQGRANFFFFAADACFLTGLVGYNKYCNVEQFADVAGLPGYSDEFDPNYERYRIRNNYPDGTFMLDWEAFADTEVACFPPEVEIINPLTGEPWRKDMLDPDNYDLTYGVKNHMLVKVYPADRRDMPVSDDAIIMYSGPDKDNTEPSPRFENQVLGRVEKGREDETDREVYIYVDPTGTGEATAGLIFQELKNMMFSSMDLPDYYLSTAIQALDVVKGIELIPEVAGSLKVGVESTLTVKVVVAGGANEPVEGVKVSLDDESGVVSAQSATTNAKGLAEFSVTPTKAGKIIIKANDDKYGMASVGVDVEVEVAPPMLIVDSPPTTTKESKIMITGRTNIGASVKIADAEADVDAEGVFSREISLQNGFNSIEITATNTVGMTTSLTVGVTRDSIPPEVIFDQEGVDVFGPDVVLSGKVEPYSKVTVNGQPASVVYDTWRIELKNVEAGDFALEIVAVDPAENEMSYDFTVHVIERIVMVIQEGSSSITMNGNPAGQFNRAPYVEGGVYYAPLTFLTTFFGDATPTTMGDNTTANVDGKMLTMVSGDTEFTIDGETSTMPNAPVDRMGIVFVDVNFFATLFEIETTRDQASGKMTLELVR